MVCIQCGSETKVANSRHQKRSNQVWRRRQCLGCGLTVTTEEIINYSGVWRVRNKQGQLEDFEPLKLTLSIYRSLQHRPKALNESRQLTITAISKLQAHKSVIDRSSLVSAVQVALNRFDKAASVYYEAHHHTN